jgi:hypothetical protein
MFGTRLPLSRTGDAPHAYFAGIDGAHVKFVRALLGLGCAPAELPR